MKHSAKQWVQKTLTGSIGRIISQPSENIFTFEVDFQFFPISSIFMAYLMRLRTTIMIFFSKKISKAITFVIGESKFEQFSESLCHLNRLKNVNDLAKVLYRYFKQESNVELQSDINVILDMNEKEKSILKNCRMQLADFLTT